MLGQRLVVVCFSLLSVGGETSAMADEPLNREMITPRDLAKAEQLMQILVYNLSP